MASLLLDGTHSDNSIVRLQRGKFPIVVGGTGLYLRWLVQGRPQTPKSDAEMAGKAQQALDKVSRHISMRQHSVLIEPVCPDL